MQIRRIGSGEGAAHEAWARAGTAQAARLRRPRDVPRAESVDEVALWAESEDFRRTELIFAPVFWVGLPLAAIGFLVQQAIADPTGAGWNKSFFGETVGVWPTWFITSVWAGAVIWLLIAVGVLVLRLSVLRDLRGENERVFEHGVAHSIHRSSFDDDSGEASGWATYIALDHHLTDAQAARIHEAFEQWLSRAGLPPSGTGPISSATLFGPEAQGGYFIMHLPVSTTAGVTTKYRWMLITQPQKGEDEVIVTPVPVGNRLRKLRAKAARKERRRRAR